MDYQEFYRRFAGSYRTRNISWYSLPPMAAIRKLTRKPYKKNHRAWKLPRDTELPKEFVRLCPWEGEYLFNLAKLSKLGIVEIGRFRGGSCFLLSCANPDVNIYGIDIGPENDARLLELFRKCGVGDNVELIVGDSQQNQYSQIRGYDVLWIDGDHSYQGCTKDLRNWYENLEIGGHVVLPRLFRRS